MWLLTAARAWCRPRFSVHHVNWWIRVAGKVATGAVGSGRSRKTRRLGCAAVGAEPSGEAARRSGDGRGALAAAHPAPDASRFDGLAGQAAAGIFSVVAHSAANTAGAFIASDECGRRQL